MSRILDNMNLARFMANKFRKGVLEEYDDLFQAACVGLVKADQRYIEGDVPFSAFAAQHIQWEIFAMIKKYHRVSEKTHIKDIANMINKRKLNDEPVEWLAGHLKKPIGDVERAVKFLKAEILSLDFEISSMKDGGQKDFYNLHRYKEDFDSAILKEQLVNSVSDKYRPAVKMYLDEVPYPEICETLGVNAKAAQYKVMRGLKELRDKEHLIM